MSRRHTRNLKPAAASEKNPANFGDLSTFTFKRVLSKNFLKKEIVVEGYFTDREGRAILVLEKTPFTEEAAAQSICTSESILENQFFKDHGLHTWYPEPRLGGLKTTIIFPATDEDFKNYELQPMHLIEETPKQYNEITLPHVTSESSNIQSVHGILTHQAEQDRIVFEDADPDVGFFLLPDSKWDQKEITNLHLLAISHRQNIKTLRDLTAEHLPLLKNIRDKGTRAINKKFKVGKSRLIIYLDYQPSYHQLHIHFTYLQPDTQDIQIGKSHLLNTVIDNIELVPDYYQRCTLPFFVKESDKLFSLFKQEQKAAIDEEDDLERTGYETDNSEQSTKSIFESTTLNNSDSIIYGSEDEKTKNKSIFLHKTMHLGDGSKIVKTAEMNNHDDSNNETDDGVRRSRRSNNSASAKEGKISIDKDDSGAHKKKRENKRSKNKSNSFNDDVNDDDETDKIIKIEKDKIIAKIENESNDGVSDNDDTINETGVVEIKTENNSEIEDSVPASNDDDTAAAAEADEDSDDIFTIKTSFIKKKDESQLEEESEAEEQEKAKNNKKKRKGEVLEENVKHEKKKNKDKKVKEVPEEIKNQEKKKSTDKKRKGEISEEDEKNEKKKNKDKKVKEEEDDDEEGDKNKEDDVSEENDEQEKTKKKEKKRKGEIPEEDEKHEKKKSKDKKRKDEISEDEKHEKKKNKDKKVKEEAEEDDDDDDGDDVSEENEEQEKTKNKEKKRKGETPEEHEKKKNKDKKIKEEDDDDEDKNKEDDASEENEEQEKRDESPSKRKRVEIQYENGASKESSESEVEIIKKKKRGPTNKKKIVLSDSDEEYKVISDSEDGKSSESDSKGTKRKKATSSSVGSSDEGSKKKTKKKRKRIIHRGDSSSDNEEKADLDSSQNKGRRNIKKIIKDVDVAETTRSAAKDEEERKQRILDRQKAYNEMFKLIEENAGKKIEKLVLDFDPKTKEELISVDKGLVAKMKPHQANGVKFMWDACFESLERIKDGEGCGCILAHCMGLGKTFQVISLVHTVLSHQDLTKVRTVLVVCPFSTVLNWYGEFEKWMEDVEENDDLNVCHISNEKVNYKRAYRLKDWHEDGGVMIIGYDMYRNLTNENSKAIKKKVREVFQRTLVDPGPDLIVCDEGHMLKNEATALSKAMNKIRTLRRIVLTGTPLQNNLSEYHCMVNFVKPNLLGTKKEFTNRFVNPITNGQFADSTERDFKIMKRRAHVLHKMLDGLVQRRDYNVLTPYLPPKQEYVLSIRLTDLQVQLYREFLETKVNITKGFRVTLFADFQQLSRIWTHPLALKYSLERQMKKEAMNDSGSDSAGSLKDFVIDSDEDSTPASSSSESEGSTKNTKSKTTNNSGRMTRANAKNGVAELETMKDDPDVAPVTVQETSSWWNGIVKPEHFEDICVSSKLVLLFDFLKECEQIGEKVLVFSQSLYSLDVIEHFLDRIDEATQNGCEDSFLMGHTSSWTKGLDYFRLDGSTSGENRSAWIQSFNRESNTRARLFLISTRAGGLGINLTAANRVIIFDASWNPSHDIQSIFRVYRFGQRKPCYIYRFIAQGTMEEKVYERQIAKLSLSQRVVDEQQVNRYFSQNDLQELYNFTPADPKDAPIPTVPKDRLMADMLHAHKQWIFKIFEHDSLLDHVEEEELDEEERKAAWEDYENEKKRGFAINSAPNNVQMGNPFMQAGMPTYENVRQMVLAQNPLIPKDDLHKLVTSMLYKLYMNQQQKDLLFRQQLLQQQYAAQSVGGQQQQPYQVMRNPFSLPITQQARNTDNAMVQQASTGTAAMPQNFNQPSTSSNLNAQQNTSDTDMKK